MRAYSVRLAPFWEVSFLRFIVVIFRLKVGNYFILFVYEYRLAKDGIGTV